ncbi:MAG: ABC transporter ATP-binding protein [Spirochaetales bacterium]|nr:ABC transporter ATP-binding protein [Spirochaetales bacterium]
MGYRISGLRLRYGERSVFDGLSLELEPHTATAVLGPSGCGKTSLLMSVAGLLKQAEADRSGFEGARFGFAFQEPRLLPWLGALDNVAFVLGREMGKVAALERARTYLERVGLGRELAKRPSELSGGMRQRVSLARAFASPSDVLLMDEPFQSVDPRTRAGLVEAFLELESVERRTVLFVTHDIAEAIRIGDRVCALGGAPATIVADIRPEPKDDADRGALETRLYSLAFSGRS